MKKLWRDVREILRGAGAQLVVRLFAVALGLLGVKEVGDQAGLTAAEPPASSSK